VLWENKNPQWGAVPKEKKKEEKYILEEIYLLKNQV